MTKRNCKRFRNSKYGYFCGLKWCGLRGNWRAGVQSDNSEAGNSEIHSGKKGMLCWCTA